MTTTPDTTPDHAENGAELATGMKARPGANMMGLLLAKREALAAVAANHLTPERLIKSFGAACSRVPGLLQCTPVSALNCVMTCSELGLLPGALGEVYLIPFRNGRTGNTECQLIIGYRGLLALARRSGQISTIQAGVVRKGDVFEFAYGIEQTFRHEPKAEHDAPITHAWALVRFRDGSHQLEVMTRSEVDAIRKRSRAGGSGPWVTDYPEMAKKTVLRRLSKMLPLTAEVAQAIETADRAEFNLDELGDIAPAPGKGVDALVDRLEGGEQGDAPADTPPEGETPAPIADDPLAGSTPLDRPAPPAPRGRK